MDHIIGLPRKEQEKKPTFDYQKLLYDGLLIRKITNPLKQDFKHKHLWIKKATGLGTYRIFLRGKTRCVLMSSICRNWFSFSNVTRPAGNQWLDGRGVPDH